MSTINRPLIERIEKHFKERFGSEPEHIARAPGRVNLLGEHVDYNDGFVMPAAIERATYVAFSPSRAEASQVIAADFAEQISFTPDSILTKTQTNRSPLPEWGLYPAGVMQMLLKHGVAVQPVQAVFSSDVPRGAGLSSSASVETAFLTTWQRLAGWAMPLMERARVCQKAENQYVGVNCGIMDQFASVCGVENRLLLLDCRSLDWNTVPIPENVAIVIADTTVRRRLTSGVYNQRRSECEQAVQLLSRHLPGVRTLRDVALQDFNRLAAELPPVIEKRARHVVEEIERTNQARIALELGAIEQFGRLMNACHASLRDLYEVSSFELDTMVSIAQSLEGCLGARLTGAGFGGCTVNLVESARMTTFADQLKARYRQATGLNPEIYLTRASDGANLVK
ncbi:galactokinase [Longilinea arvoryzae]|uniref:Galactokinase n=1 Tax=Longilinea arvoryzae TaxID=360412 RepID=A0A0S7BA78_9CHLR|nr:galactokinase [Longilinea arvoryzae]GAP14495.1 galactokinase [Longilinea arvoryzae]